MDVPPPAPSPWGNSLTGVLIGCGVAVVVVGFLGLAVATVFLMRGFMNIAPALVHRPAPALRGCALKETADVDAPDAPLKPLPDADALAQRMPWNQELYRHVRDGALDGFRKLHATPASFDDEAMQELKLEAYLAVWDDYYGEGLWQQFDAHVDHLDAEGARYTVFSLMSHVHGYETTHSANEEGAQEAVKETLEFETTFYPALFKFLIYKSQLGNLIYCRNDSDISAGPGTAFDKLPQIRELALKYYGVLLSENLPQEWRFRYAQRLLGDVQDDEPTLEAVSAGITQKFKEVDPTNPLVDVLKGSFLVDAAWNARGSGWASSVTPDGWKLFGERLEQADQILDQVYQAHPDQVGVSEVKMRVALGRQKPREEMELWFERGLKIDADPVPLYNLKRNYLLPRWYGSDEDELAFGLESAKSEDWKLKTPLALLEGLDDAAERDPGVYARPEVWAPLEKVFRGYLEHFPNALTYRTRFFKVAVEGGHWAVAREQMQSLGDDWDRAVLPSNEFEQAQRLITQHADDP